MFRELSNWKLTRYYIRIYINKHINTARMTRWNPKHSGASKSSRSILQRQFGHCFWWNLFYFSSSHQVETLQSTKLSWRRVGFCSGSTSKVISRVWELQSRSSHLQVNVFFLFSLRTELPCFGFSKCDGTHTQTHTNFLHLSRHSCGRTRTEFVRLY